MPDLPFAKAREHPYKMVQLAKGSHQRGQVSNSYVELAVTSNFTFLTGASYPDELVLQAAMLGHSAVAITDTNSLAGIVRAHVVAKESNIQLIVGARVEFQEPQGFSLFVYPTDRPSYGRLCQLLTLGKRRAPKGDCHLCLDGLISNNEGLLAIVGPMFPESHEVHLNRLRDAFDDDRLSLAIWRHYGPYEDFAIQSRANLANRLNIPLVAVNDVHYHMPERQFLQDVLVCIRRICTLSEAENYLFPNGERYLKPADEMHRLFADYPKALARTVEIAARTRNFTLDQLRYEYPEETCPTGVTPMDHMKRLTWEGARERYPTGVPPKVVKQIEHEFWLIEELGYAPYFLTVHDIVKFARSRDILCQGRGAAANSAVCFCLGVTSVDPDRIDVLFERFVSRERNEPPDIDIDFAHEDREKVIQYIYEKYGRERAALTAEVITYRRRSAIRDVGKALGLSLDAVDRIAKRVDSWEKNPFADSDSGSVPAQLVALGFDPNELTMDHFIRLVRELIGFPRHLSQHVGGFVMTRGLLSQSVPIENAAMKNRTVIAWDKDDIEALGMLKVDVLGLGMLTCISKCFELIEKHHHRKLTLATLPPEDPIVYDMICRSDTLGVFQIESRAQMTMLPRLKPRCFYDLVIEVAIVRPGPIIGDMVHPFLRRRNKEEKVEYYNKTIEEVLGKTLGVPLFQEQVMALAMRAAGFTAGEAEKLRRAITAWTSKGDIAQYPTRFIQGMLDNGYPLDFAQWCFDRMRGFSQYGFPESHAASFALLVYASSWLKCYYPAVFAAALINSQPMGFYAPAQIVRDAQDHGVTVLPVDVNRSNWDCTLEGSGQALRLGMRLVRGLRKKDAETLANAVSKHGHYRSPHNLWREAGVSASALRYLALADAFGSMGLNRQQALWAIQSLHGKPLPLLDSLFDAPDEELALPDIPALAQIEHDYTVTGLSLKDHPFSFLRDRLVEEGVITTAEAKDEKRTPYGRRVSVAGLVLFRQRPGTAKGIMFMTIEDETGRLDLIVRTKILEKHREGAIYAKAVVVTGKIERLGPVAHVLVTAIHDVGFMLKEMPAKSRDFR